MQQDLDNSMTDTKFELSPELAAKLAEQRRRVFFPTAEELAEGERAFERLRAALLAFEDDGTKAEGDPNDEHRTHGGTI